MENEPGGDAPSNKKRRKEATVFERSSISTTSSSAVVDFGNNKCECIEDDRITSPTEVPMPPPASHFGKVGENVFIDLERQLWIFHSTEKYFFEESSGTLLLENSSDQLRQLAQQIRRGAVDLANSPGVSPSSSSQLTTAETTETMQSGGVVDAVRISHFGQAVASEDDEDENEEDEDEEEISFDFEKDLHFASATIQNSSGIAKANEDKFLTRDVLPLDVIINSSACCYLTALFDGHGGDRCAEFCVQKLHGAMMGTIRETVPSIRLSRENGTDRVSERLGNSPSRRTERRRRPDSSSAAPSDPPTAYRHSVEVEALRRTLKKAFAVLDNNYLDFSKRNKLTDGCTALIALLYGPDEDEGLKLVTANCGDSRAVLCRGGKAVQLTSDHKPSVKSEASRIRSSGGRIRDHEGVTRLIVNLPGSQEIGIATSRSIGDYPIKINQKHVLISEPDVEVTAIDFDEDAFIILGTDGIWDVISNEKAVECVAASLHEGPEKAARALSELAGRAGSHDDKSVTVIMFGRLPEIDNAVVAADGSCGGGGVISSSVSGDSAVLHNQAEEGRKQHLERIAAESNSQSEVNKDVGRTAPQARAVEVTTGDGEETEKGVQKLREQDGEKEGGDDGHNDDDAFDMFS